MAIAFIVASVVDIIVNLFLLLLGIDQGLLKSIGLGLLLSIDLGLLLLGIDLCLLLLLQILSLFLGKLFLLLLADLIVKEAVTTEFIIFEVYFVDSTFILKEAVTTELVIVQVYFVNSSFVLKAAASVTVRGIKCGFYASPGDEASSKATVTTVIFSFFLIELRVVFPRF